MLKNLYAAIILIPVIALAGCQSSTGNGSAGYSITFYANAPTQDGFTWNPPQIFSTNVNQLSFRSSYYAANASIDVYTPFAASGSTYAPKCSSAKTWMGWDTLATATTATYYVTNPTLTMPSGDVTLYGIWQ
jgi:hypothetical protein